MRRRSQRTREHLPPAFAAFDIRIDHKLIAAETLRTSDAKQQIAIAAECSMADLAAWNDSDDDEPRRKKPHVDESRFRTGGLRRGRERRREQQHLK